MTLSEWKQQIEAREARVGVIGLGYVGLPLLLEFGRNGFPVMGFDIDPEKPRALKGGRSYIRHIPEERVREFFGHPERADATTDFSRAAACSALLICVPTPLTRQREPDLRFIEQTAHALAPHLRRGQLVVLESTTWPGTTEEVLVPLLERGSGLKGGTDFYAAFSPEREDPNNRQFRMAQIPKVIGGLTPESQARAEALYGAIFERTVPVSSARAAEAVKLVENIFRSVNIALVNELKVVFTEMGLDIWEIIEAAKTKPFGFMAFYPGPGLGGHCIPIDPFYLTWKAREYGVPTKFIELAGEINTTMPQYVVSRTIEALNSRGKAIRGSRLLLVGLAYKKNVDDERESPAYRLWERFEKLGAVVDYYDPFCPVVPRTREHSRYAGIRSRTWEEALTGDYDLAVIVTAHDTVDHAELARRLPLVVDTRGCLPPGPNIVRA